MNIGDSVAIVGTLIGTWECAEEKPMGFRSRPEKPIVMARIRTSCGQIYDTEIKNVRKISENKPSDAPGTETCPGSNTPE